MVGPMPADALTRATLEFPALFGKLPAHGDFISRGLSGSARDAADQWLSDWLDACRSATGAAFAQCYEAAAPWLLESPRCTVVLLPSMDAVGRRFPLLVASQPDRATQQIYDTTIDALADGATSDRLRDNLAGLPAREGGAARLPHWFLPEGAEPVLPAPDSVASWCVVEGMLL